MSQTSTSSIAENIFKNSFAKTGLMPVFTISIFLSALLLFSVQPMFAKMTLPLLGGAPNVWNTAMVFFQGTLLAGYIYAHLLSKYAPIKWQVVIHALVLIAGVLFLPLAVANGWVAPEKGAPALWLIGLYGASIGLPFFALSATAPLLQRWFSYTDHRHAHDPYFLYAASNLGSLMSLLSYPVLIEPLLGASDQSHFWTLGYYALAIAILCSGVLAFGNKLSLGKAESANFEDQETASNDDINTSAAKITWSNRAIWIALAFVPSSLMLGVTTYLSVNVASAPFVWVAPLAMYLTTFVIVFSTKPLISESFTAKMLPIAVIIGLILSRSHSIPFLILLLLNLFVFFLIALSYHGRLAALRPPVSQLTEFYIFMSVGGVLGGIFNALIAPMIFENVYEYAIILAFSGLLACSQWPNARSVVGDLLFVAVTFIAVGAVILISNNFGVKSGILLSATLMAIYLVTYINQKNALRFVGSLLAIQFVLMPLAPLLLAEGDYEKVFTDRSFFGVTTVEKVERGGFVVHDFVHGNTVHNVQIRDPEFRKVPLAYFAKQGPYDQITQAMQKRSNAPLNIHVIGLGAGTMACYARAQDNMVFYEIDPAIVDMAKNPDYFTFLQDCKPDAGIVIGDARIQIQSVEEGTLDLLIIDAFSSDAIPAHLVTREALALYRTKLKKDGMLFFHTSNRFLDVSSVVLALADDAGLEARELKFYPAKDMPFYDLLSPSTAVVMAPREVMTGTMDAFPGWSRNKANPAVGLWSDDYSHVIGALLAHQRGGSIEPAKTGNNEEEPIIRDGGNPAAG